MKYAQTEGYVSNGVVGCTSCGREYAIENGILRMPQIAFDDIIQKESTARDAEAKKYDKRLEKRQKNEIEPTLKKLGNVSNKVIVEYGAGTGRFTTRLAHKASLILASDISLISLEITARKLLEKEYTNVALVHTDSTRLPLRGNSFDLAVSFQVLEHVPHKWQRAVWYRAMYSGLKSGGRIFHTVYYHDFRRRIQKLPTRGYHSDGIYYQYYSKKLLNSEMQAHFGPLSFSYVDSMVPGLQRFVPQVLQVPLGNICTQVPFLKHFSHLIVVEGFVPAKKKQSLTSGVVFQNPSFYTKYIHWFTDPYVPEKSDHMTIFSYTDAERGFYKKKSGPTSVISLDKSLDEIWNNTRKSFVQKQINRGERKGITLSVSTEFDEFYKLYHSFRKEKNLIAESREIMEQNGFLITAHSDNQMLAAGLFIADGQTMRAWALVSDRFSSDGKMRELVGYANRMVVWHAIKYAHTHGFVLFDMGGLNKSTSNSSDKSLNEFKEAFGGEERLGYFYSGSVSRRHKLLKKIKKHLRI
ncbi:MAG: peptidoglycan bridge formation glycyltransferase FemA/FemB family protein [Patescibacteria group bacterium]